MNQFSRTQLLFGKEAMQNFYKARIAIMGLGGVGSYAAEALARSGVHKFLLVDFDKVSLSNINRQLLAVHSNLDKLKTVAMKERILDINPKAQIDIFSDFCAEESRNILLSNLDFVVDAIDSLGPKVGLLIDCCKRNIPVISVMGAASRFDPSQIELCDISQTKMCPLAKRVRNLLRRQNITSGIPVIYSKEKPIPQFSYEHGSQQEWGAERGRKRGTLGSVIYMPAIMGMWAASYILRKLSTC
ncbi:MAG: tRNA threonylcarbamoyladenosine dehydratase [Candidatus Cloacimonadota bacterium]|nr:tRNA threonylcarbamoyladenosine dehydratase [Candidatus Cloacimonadota bacterium]